MNKSIGRENERGELVLGLPNTLIRLAVIKGQRHNWEEKLKPGLSGKLGECLYLLRKLITKSLILIYHQLLLKMRPIEMLSQQGLALLKTLTNQLESTKKIVI